MTFLKPAFSKRERQIMDILYRLQRATAVQIQAGMPGEPNYSTIRAQLRVLEEKGHVRHIEEGTRFVYLPVVAKENARRSALRHLVETFFDGSPESAVAALLGGEGKELTEEELDRIAKRIEAARKGAEA